MDSCFIIICMGIKSVFQISLILVLLSACNSSTATVASGKTATSKPLPINTATPPPTYTAIPTLPVTLSACVTNETIRIRQGPGTDFEVVGGLVSGTCITILGRNSDSTWVYIETAGNSAGWVAVWLLTIDGDLNKVLVRNHSIVANSSESTAVATKAVVNTPDSQAIATILAKLGMTQTVDMPLCSQSTGQVASQVKCKIERAHCEYRPDVDGNPTFCNDRPYPNHNFQLVAWDQDLSEYDGRCIIVSGFLETYAGVLQIQVYSTNQVSYCY